MTINIAPRFLSPLRKEITIHKNIERLVGETVELMKKILNSGSQKGDAGLDALGLLVVSHTNIDQDTTKLISNPPAPSIKDQTHYHNFIHTLCELLSQRYL